jgi:hypothetical protein
MRNCRSLLRHPREMSSIVRNSSTASWVLRFVIILSLFADRATAHHSFAAEFDRSRPVILTGLVTKLEWQNPHTRLYIDVVDAERNLVSWELELSSPNGLMRAGWTRHSVQIGDKITVRGFLAKDGSRLANARNILTADGKTILSETVSADQAQK